MVNFGKAFLADMQESYEFWKLKQRMTVSDNIDAKAQIDAITFSKWAMMLLQKPVYELLGAKRASEDDGPETPINA